MRQKRKCPEGVQQHTNGAGAEANVQHSFQSQIYATYGELQTRHLSCQCGLSLARARMIAVLVFGEGRR